MKQINSTEYHMESESYLKAILDSSFSGIMALQSLRDADGEIIDFVWTLINDRAEGIVGRSQAELIGKRLLEVLPGNHEAGLFDLYVNVVETGEPLDHEHYYEYDGLQYWFRTTAVKLNDGFVVTFNDITKRKNAEDALRFQHDELERFFTVALDLLCIATTDGYFIKVNKQWEDVLGYSTQALQGRKFLDFVHPDDMQVTLDAMRQLGEDKPILNFINRYRAKDGTYRTIEWRSFPHNQIIYAAARDITARQQMEDSLLESYAHLRDLKADVEALLNHSSDMIVVTEMDASILQTNRAFDVALGYEVDALFKKSALTIFDAESLPKASDRIAKVIDDGVSQRFGAIICRQSGAQLYADVALSAVESSDSGKRLLFSIRDITERKMAEEALRRSELEHRALFEQSNDAVFIMDLTGRYLRVNQRATEMLGYETDELLSLSHREIIVPDEYEDSAHVLARLLRGEKVPPYERTLRRKDGSQFHAEVNVEIVRDSDGNPIHTQSILRDITERKEAQSREMEMILEQKRRELLRQFIEKTSHEFRTPLSIINSNMYLTARTDDPEKRAEFYRRTEKQTRVITDLIDSLLEVLKLDMDSDNIQQSMVNMNYIMHSVCSDMEAISEGATIHRELSSDLPAIRGADFYLQNMFRHILHNARRYTPAEGNITVRAYATESAIIVQIEDDGVGISDEDMPYIFDTFWRKDSAHTTPGLGLGLSIVQKIAQIHGGEIDIDSTVGQGTTVTVILPLT